MKVSALISEGEARLTAAGVPEARIKVEWWVSEVLGVSRDVLEHKSADEKQAARIYAGLDRLEKHEPLQYVIGHTPFLNVELITDSRALVPRPETEELVSIVLQQDELWSVPEVKIADVGTGSGCIAIALAYNNEKAVVSAIDQSDEALALAAESAEKNGVGGRVAFFKADLLADIAAESLDAVVSNPPYIATEDVALLEQSVKDFEPFQALDGGSDGLEVICRLIPQAFTGLKNGGRLWLEIGDDHGESVYRLLAEASFRDVRILQDMYGQDRFAEAVK